MQLEDAGHVSLPKMTLETPISILLVRHALIMLQRAYYTTSGMSSVLKVTKLNSHRSGDSRLTDQCH